MEKQSFVGRFVSGARRHIVEKRADLVRKVQEREGERKEAARQQVLSSYHVQIAKIRNELDGTSEAVLVNLPAFPDPAEQDIDVLEAFITSPVTEKAIKAGQFDRRTAELIAHFADPMATVTVSGQEILNVAGLTAGQAMKGFKEKSHMVAGVAATMATRGAASGVIAGATIANATATGYRNGAVKAAIPVCRFRLTLGDLSLQMRTMLRIASLSFHYGLIDDVTLSRIEFCILSTHPHTEVIRPNGADKAAGIARYVMQARAMSWAKARETLVGNIRSAEAANKSLWTSSDILEKELSGLFLTPAS